MIRISRIYSSCDIKSLKYLLKFLFVPGVFIINDVQFQTGCVKIVMDYYYILSVVYASYQVLPYTFAFIVAAIIMTIIQYFNENCLNFLNKKLVKFLKFVSLFSLTSVLLVSVFLWWLGFAGNALSVFYSAVLILIMFLNYINTQILKIIK